MADTQQKELKRARRVLNRRRLIELGLFVMAFIAIVGILMLRMYPKQYTLDVGFISMDDIAATRNVENSVLTNQRIEQAVATVDANPKYKRDDAISAQVIQAVDDNFSQLMEAIHRIRMEIANPQQPAASSPPHQDGQLDPSFVNLVRSGLYFIYTNQEMEAVARLDENIVSRAIQSTQESLTAILNNGISAQFLDSAKAQIISSLESTIPNMDRAMLMVCQRIIHKNLAANSIFDQEATDLARENAMKSIQPVIVEKGEWIVRQGDVISVAQHSMLQTLGLLANSGIDWQLLMGVVLLVLLLLILVSAYLVCFELALVQQTKKLILLGSLLVLSTGLMMAFGLLDMRIVPAAYGAMIAAVLLSPGAAVAVQVAISVMAAFMAGEGGMVTHTSVQLCLSSLGTGIASMVVLRRTGHRGHILTAGLIGGTAGMTIYLAMGMMTTGDWEFILVSSGLGLMAGLFSAVLCLGTMPAWEWLFNIVTPMKLMELSSPEQPLLKRLQMETPGTYHHSIIVANLAQSAAERIGANAILARTGAYYHDVGKLRRPYYFKENQLTGENPHDELQPLASVSVVIGHVVDGVQLAQKYNLPQEIIDIIYQHHGNSLIAYFYHKAKENAKEGTLDTEVFRYPCHRPTTREAAIVMLADTVEAAVRSMKKPTHDEMEQMITKLVRARLDDGQLDEAPISLRDLFEIRQTFMQCLSGIHHQRIEYPDPAHSNDSGETLS